MMSKNGEDDRDDQSQRFSHRPLPESQTSFGALI
jgi:hypothetical protein